MTDPATTIREALEWMDSHGILHANFQPNLRKALAALTQLEQQLAGERIVLHVDWQERAEAAERERDQLADTLREIQDGTTPDRIGQYGALRDWVNKTARAALDRHTQP